MATQAQIIANQSNAALSTGPRTPEGKAVSSRNAMKFGLTSKRIVIPGEDPAQFEAVFNAILEQAQAATECEHLIAQDIACLHWRIERIENVKTSYITSELSAIHPGNHELAIGAIMNSDPMRRFDKYLATERRAYENAWRRLKAMQKERKDNERREAEARREEEKAQLQNEANSTPPRMPKTSAATATRPMQSPPAPEPAPAVSPERPDYPE